MEYLRTVDLETFDRTEGRVSEALLGRDSGATSSMISLIKTPAGGGSPEGLHTHPFDQAFYVLSGTMNLEIDGGAYQAGAGTLVVFPQGVPHRNWNEGPEPTVHLAVNTPLPDPDQPFAQRVE